MVCEGSTCLEAQVVASSSHRVPGVPLRSCEEYDYASNSHQSGPLPLPYQHTLLNSSGINISYGRIAENDHSACHRAGI